MESGDGDLRVIGDSQRDEEQDWEEEGEHGYRGPTMSVHGEEARHDSLYLRRRQKGDGNPSAEALKGARGWPDDCWKWNLCHSLGGSSDQRGSGDQSTLALYRTSRRDAERRKERREVASCEMVAGEGEDVTRWKRE
jgi:hypothetical protein